MSIAVTVDVESDWGGRVDEFLGLEIGLPYILELLESTGIKATFFVSGAVVPRYKEMVRKIGEAGHEVASHGLTHENHSLLSKERLLEEINMSKRLLVDEIGAEILGFRAPQYRVNSTLFDVLANLHFKYDSSFSRGIVPTRYSGLSVPKTPFLLENGLLEIPVSSTPYLRIPLGLRWINLIGFTTIKFILDKFTLPQPAVFYLHPFDLIQPVENPQMSFIIKKWYSCKAGNSRKTLEQMLNYWKTKGNEFVLLKEVFLQSKEAY
ncbi:polysaccharide deacetylase family protein [Chloroflexota bacterium]